MASIWRKYTTINLLTTEYDLKTFEKDAFPETMFNNNPSSPFENLSEKRDIRKVVIKPLFCRDADEDS